MGASDSGVAFFEKLASAWNANDGVAFAGLFTEDGVTLLVRDGDVWRLVDSRPYAYSTPPPSQIGQADSSQRASQDT